MGLPPCDTLEDARCLLFRELAKDEDDKEVDLNSHEIDSLIRKFLKECKREDEQKVLRNRGGPADENNNHHEPCSNGIRAAMNMNGDRGGEANQQAAAME